MNAAQTNTTNGSESSHTVSGGEQGQFVDIAPAQALHQAGMLGGAGDGRRVRHHIIGVG